MSLSSVLRQNYVKAESALRRSRPIRHWISQERRTYASNASITKISAGVAVVQLSNPPVNALAPSLMKDLSEVLGKINNDSNIHASVIHGAGKNFVAGADITFFQRFQAGKATWEEMRDYFAMARSLLTAIEASPKPSVAAIEGVALGGGLELAMSCHARVCDPKAQLGLPELTLGLLPGFGGTIRLPRLIGVKPALDMILSTEPVQGELAGKLGLVDAVVDNAVLLPTALQLAHDMAHGVRPIRRTLDLTDKLASPEEVQRLALDVRATLPSRFPNQPHPDAMLDALLYGLHEPDHEKALVHEAELCMRMCGTTTSKGLVHYFLAPRASSKVPGVTDIGLKPNVTKHMGVVGSGETAVMMTSTALVHGCDVWVKVDQDHHAAFKDALQHAMTSWSARAGLREERLHVTSTYDHFKHLPFVIEAVEGGVAEKQKQLAELEKVVSDGCTIASASSCQDIEELAALTTSTHRIIGLSFPPTRLGTALVEVVRTRFSGEQSIVDGLAVCKMFRRTPLVVRNSPGFVIDRLLHSFLVAKDIIADLGVDAYRLDEALMQFGLASGPFRLADEVGIDNVEAKHRALGRFHPYTIYDSKLPKLLIQERMLGEETREGYYVYDHGLHDSPNPRLPPLLQQSCAAAPLPKEWKGRFSSGSKHTLSSEQLVEMALFPVVNEACRLVQEGLVTRASDIDMASVLGFSFPNYRGGILKFGDIIGAKTVWSTLRTWYDLLHLPLLQPSEYLEKCARRERPLTSLDVLQPIDAGSPDDVVVTAAFRTPLLHHKNSLFKNCEQEDLLSVVVRRVLESTPKLDRSEVGEVVVGRILGKTDESVAHIRVAALMAGLPVSVPVHVTSRVCASGVQALIDTYTAIHAGLHKIGIAAGYDLMSRDTMTFFSIKPHPAAPHKAHGVYCSKGQTSENLVQRHGVTREEQDLMAYSSHRKAAIAQRSGKLKGQIVPVTISVHDGDGQQAAHSVVVDTDNGIRHDISLDVLSGLKSFLYAKGSTTAATSSPLADGAAAALLMTRARAAALGVPIKAVIRSVSVVAVEPAVMGEGCLYAIPKALSKAGISINDVDIFEIHESYASSAVYCMQVLNIPQHKVNPNGGSLAFGHAGGATGLALVSNLLAEMDRRRAQYGMVAMSVGTGMGVAVLFERTARS